MSDDLLFLGRVSIYEVPARLCGVSESISLITEAFPVLSKWLRAACPCLIGYTSRVGTCMR